MALRAAPGIDLYFQPNHTTVAAFRQPPIRQDRRLFFIPKQPQLLRRIPTTWTALPSSVSQFCADAVRFRTFRRSNVSPRRPTAFGCFSGARPPAVAAAGVFQLLP